MQHIHYTLGLDIGIGSVGWAVLQNDAKGEPIRIQDLGVRIFDRAEQPKTGESLAAPRRTARSARRRLRRHRHRLERIRDLLERQNVISRESLAVLYEKGGFTKSPYQLRAEGLDRLLDSEEFSRVLIHLAQRRGYQSNSTAFVQPFYKPKRDGTPGPRVDKVKLCKKSTLNIPINGGVAANGDMLRIDVFYVEDDGYYFVPLYVPDTKKKALPNKAVVAHKPYDEWKEMREEDFLFSLYPGDLVCIRSKKGVKLSLAKGGTGDREITRQEGLYYYQGSDISAGAITITTHDRRYSQSGLGVKTLQSIEKYQVDVLGNYHKVRLPEKRMSFCKEG